MAIQQCTHVCGHGGCEAYICSLDDGTIFCRLLLTINTMWLMQLDTKVAVKQYGQSKRRLLVLGYNATLTTAVEAPRQPKRHFDQIKVLSRLQSASVTASVRSYSHRQSQSSYPHHSLRGASVPDACGWRISTVKLIFEPCPRLIGCWM